MPYFHTGIFGFLKTSEVDEIVHNVYTPNPVIGTLEGPSGLKGRRRKSQVIDTDSSAAITRNVFSG